MKNFHINELYVPPMVFSTEQKINFTSLLQSSFALLRKLCLESSLQIKKIVYLAEDIVEIAKTIPAVINKNINIDMRSELCLTVLELANLASQVEIGLPVNIDKQINVMRNNCAVS